MTIEPPHPGAAVPPAIQATDLRRSFGDNLAVAGVDLTVDRGEVYGFLGPNGAGKSTTVRMLCTLLLPSSGRATVAGHDIVDQAGDVRLRIGVALQDASLDGKQTGREIITLQGRLYGLAGDHLRARVEHAANLADIGDALDDRVGSYSGGMKRRLDLAAALVHEPEVLFLDEPTTGLDPASRARVWEEVERLNREGMTIFLTTQYLEEADRLADRVGIIDDGRIVAEGTPADLKRRIGTDVVIASIADGSTTIDANTHATLEQLSGVTSVERNGDELVVATADGARMIGDVAIALAEHGLVAESLTVRSPSLDDVFLHATGHRIEPTATEARAA